MMVPKTAIFPAHEWRMGIGYKPFESAFFWNNFLKWDVPDLRYGMIDFDVPDYYRGARFTTHALQTEYTYQANKWLGVGVTGVYFSYFNQYLNEQTEQQVGKNVVSHFSLYPTLRYTWLNRPSFSLYSSFGLGARFVNEHDNLKGEESNSQRFSIAGQFTLIGFTIGKQFYVYSDLSTLGTQGFTTIGIGYRIHRKGSL